MRKNGSWGYFGAVELQIDDKLIQEEEGQTSRMPLLFRGPTLLSGQSLVGEFLVGCGIPRHSRDPHPHPKIGLEDIPRTVISTLSKYVLVYMVVDKLNFSWNLMGSGFTGTS